MNRRSLLLVFGSLALSLALIAQPEVPPKSPWLGVWSGKLGDYGLVVVNIEDQGTGQLKQTKVWWLVEELHLTANPRLEGDTLFLDRVDHKKQPAPGLAFQLVAPNQLKLSPFGVLPEPLDPLLANLILTKNTPSPREPELWYDVTTYRRSNNEWDKWHEEGNLKPLPAEWPATIVIPTALLLSDSAPKFSACLLQTTLPSEFLAHAYAMIEDNPAWTDQKTYLLLAIAKNQNTSRETLAAIWDEPNNPQLWIAVTRHPKALPEWPAMLVERVMQGDASIQARALYSGDGPPELYARLLQKNRQLRESMAGNIKLPVFVYETLFRDYSGEYGIARALARNEAMPVPILEELSRQSDRSVLFQIIRNKTLPTESRLRAVQQLTANAHLTELERLARDQDAPTDFLTRCAGDLDPAVRAAVARNPNTGLAIVLQLTEDDTRQVAEAARTVLDLRSPTDYAARSANWKALDTLIADNTPSTRFVRAAVQGDRTEMERLITYLRETQDLDRILPWATSELLATSHTEIMDRLLEFDRDGRILANLAGECGGNQTWLKYLAAKGAFANGKVGYAYVKAVESDKLENLTGLLAAHLDPNLPGRQGYTALHTAVMRRNMPAVYALVRAGARGDLPDQRGNTAIDYAIKLNFIPLVRIMDKAGKHAALIQAFEKEYPPAPHSPFLGQWGNNKDGFDVMGLKLDGDGTGLLSGGVMVIAIGWKQTGPSEAILTILLEPDMKQRAPTARLTLDTTGQMLSFVPDRGEEQKMRRIAAEK